jgi:superfamily II DNA/RNA helicase
MPHGPRSSRTSSSGYASSSGDRASSGRPARRARSGGSASSTSSAPRRSPASRQAPGSRTRNGQSAAPRPTQQSELDRALAAAAATPPPAPATFGELGLDERLVAALAARGINEPFAIQARALPDALAGRNVLGKAQTGSGKTLAFGLPMLNRLAVSTAERKQKTPLGLVLVPTRELAQQVADVLGPLGRSVGVDVTTVYGGVPINRQIDRVRNADVIVATPGRLIDLLERRACTLGGIAISVLDEADHMADLGFMPAVCRILDEVPSSGQRMFFSATLDRDVAKLVTAYVSDPALHAVPVPADSSLAEHSLLVLSQHDKVPVAAEIAGRPGRTLFFVRTKHGADRLAKQLTRAGVGAAVIHGDRNQNQRQRALDGFAAGHPRVLVATDVAARGIHVDDVDLIVQFDPPGDHKDYLHRSGRTARAGATGMVVALVDQAQVRELEKMHEAAGVTAARHDVVAGDRVVRELATSGTPVTTPPRASTPPRAAMSASGTGTGTPPRRSARRRSPSRSYPRQAAAAAPSPRRES